MLQTVKNRGSTEHISGFKIIRISQLPLVIKKLRSLRSGPKVRFYRVQNWKEWGEFRAIAHQVVYDLLKIIPKCLCQKIPSNTLMHMREV
jgi:hypothetical protein